MNLIRTGRNIFKFNRLNAKGGGGLPHFDPPDMKRVQNKRFFTLHDHILWFKDSVEQQYYVIIKHNQFKGMSGILYNLFRYFFVGTYCVVMAVVYIKSIAHDTKNYYFVNLIPSKGNVMYDNHISDAGKMERYRDLVAENKGKDFLGRRSAQYYHIPGTLKIRTDLQCSLDKKLDKLTKSTPAGKGSA